MKIILANWYVQKPIEPRHLASIENYNTAVFLVPFGVLMAKGQKRQGCRIIKGKKETSFTVVCGEEDHVAIENVQRNIRNQAYLWKASVIEKTPAGYQMEVYQQSFPKPDKKEKVIRLAERYFK